MALSWMAWTWQTGVFFALIASALVAMTVWELARPGGHPRIGVLGLLTTRGDRLFMSLLAGAFIHLGALALGITPLYLATIAMFVVAVLIFTFV